MALRRKLECWSTGSSMHYLVLFLESIFFIGLAGSLVVSILAFVGDFHDFFEKDDPEGVVNPVLGD